MSRVTETTDSSTDARRGSQMATCSRHHSHETSAASAHWKSSLCNPAITRVAAIASLRDGSDASALQRQTKHDDVGRLSWSCPHAQSPWVALSGHSALPVSKRPPTSHLELREFQTRCHDSQLVLAATLPSPLIAPLRFRYTMYSPHDCAGVAEVGSDGAQRQSSWSVSNMHLHCG
jgi:hypothetical protein